jgi:WD40 repeat protein
MQILFVSIVVLALAALACGPIGSGGATSAPIPTKGTEGGGDTGGTTDGGEETPTEEGGGTTDGGSTDGGSSGGGGGAIDAGNVEELADLQTITVSTQALLAVAVSGSGHEVATAGADSIMRLWDGDTGKKLREYPRLSDYGFGLAYSRDGKTLASGAGFEVTLWDPETGKKIKSVTPNAGVYRMAISPDGETLAVAGQRRSKLDLIDVGSGQITTVASPAGYELWSAAFSLDGKLIAAADNQGNLTVFEADSKAQAGTASAKGAAWDVEFSPDGKYVTSCNATSDIGGISTWDTSTYAPYDDMTMPEVHKGGCLDGAYSLDGDIFFSAGADGVLNAWDTTNGELLLSEDFGTAIWAIAVSGDGKILAAALNDGTLHILGLK